MSVLSHLIDCATNAVLTSDERESINTSISTLASRLRAYFGNSIIEQIRFGSSTRDTILPRIIDEHSDIDYMIVFSDTESKPQTYLDRIKRFAENSYARSEIVQSSPTIVLSLNHIKFDLVPALKGYFSGSYRIPGSSSSYSEWIDTNPNDFNGKLTQANMQHKSLIKPLIRLMKYWNSNSGYVFDSYSLEQHIVQNSWSGSNLKDYLFNYVHRMTPDWSDAQWRKDRIQRAKDIVQKTEQYEHDELPYSAEDEIKKLLPKYW